MARRRCEKCQRVAALRELLRYAVGELREHNAIYHYRTPEDVLALLEIAVTEESPKTLEEIIKRILPSSPR